MGIMVLAQWLTKTKALGNNKNSNNKSDNNIGYCQQWYFSDSHLLKWPDSILRGSFKGPVIWNIVHEIVLYVDYTFWTGIKERKMNFKNYTNMFYNLQGHSFYSSLMQALGHRSLPILKANLNTLYPIKSYFHSEVINLKHTTLALTI